MDKSKALQLIENFKESSYSVISNSNEPSTKGDIQKLANRIATLAENLVEIISE